MRLPQRPTGRTPADLYHQRIWDVIRSLIPIRGRGTKMQHTTRGTLIDADPSGGTSPVTPSDLDIPEWDDSGYSTGDYVRRTAGINDTLAIDAEGVNAAQAGNRIGIWRAAQDIAAGAATPPVIGSSVWTFIGGLATQILTLENSTFGSVQASALVDPFVNVAKAGANDRIQLDTALTNGKHLRPVEVDVCVNGEKKKMMIIGSDPY